MQSIAPKKWVNVVLGVLALYLVYRLVKRSPEHVNLSDRILPLPGQLTGYIRHRDGKCVTARGHKLTLNHCVRNAASQIFHYDERSIVQVSTQLRVVAWYKGANIIGLRAQSHTVSHNEYVIPTTPGGLMLDGKCIVPVTGPDYPCENTDLVRDAMVVGCQDQFEILTQEDYDSEHWYMNKVKPWSCSEDLCGMNFYGSAARLCNDCNDWCLSLVDCVTVIVQSDNLSSVYNMIRSLYTNVPNTKNVNVIVVHYHGEESAPSVKAATLRFTEEPNSMVERVRALGNVQVIVTTSPSTAARRNQGLSLVKTSYFLLVEQQHRFTGYTNLKKMLEIMTESTTSLVAGSPTGSMPRILYVKQVTPGIELVATPNITYKNNEAFSTRFPSCDRVDIVPSFFMAKTTAIRELGGWSEDLYYFSNLEMVFKYKVSEIDPIMCSDVVVASLDTEAVMIDPISFAKYSNLLLERLGLQRFVFCKEGLFPAAIPVCKGVLKEYNTC